MLTYAVYVSTLIWWKNHEFYNRWNVVKDVTKETWLPKSNSLKMQYYSSDIWIVISLDRFHKAVLTAGKSRNLERCGSTWNRCTFGSRTISGSQFNLALVPSHRKLADLEPSSTTTCDCFQRKSRGVNFAGGT